MSPRRSPKSLYTRTLDIISRASNKICLRNLNVLDNVISCMKVLPHTIQEAIGERIIEELEDEALRLPTPSQVIIVLALKSKRVIMGGSIFEDHILDGQDASHLKFLSLQYAGIQERIPKVFPFLSTASSLTHLEAVDFFNDTMMEVVASSCSNLYCLSLRNCPLTDYGILKLCGFTFDLRTCLNQLESGVQLNPISPCANSLRELKITMTKVGDPGVAVILLVMKKLTLLRIPDIRISNIFTYLDKLTHDNIKCNLLEFHSREHLDQSKLKVLAKLCPNLEYIQVSFTGIYDIDIHIVKELTKLKYLTGAKFANLHSSALKFFIDCFGTQMKKLHLYCYPPKAPNEKIIISRSQIHSLAKASDNLKYLCLEDYSLDEDDNDIQNIPTHFKNLTTLKLKSLSLKQEDLRMFLSESKEMQELEINIENPGLLHDKFVQSLVTNGIWAKLSRVTILNAPLTAESLSSFINYCPDLKYLARIDSWLIPPRVVNSYKEWISQKNFDLKVL